MAPPGAIATSKYVMITTPMISSLNDSLIAQYAQELFMCYDPDVGFLYFADKFAKYIDPRTHVSSLKLYDFQKDYLRHINQERISVNLLARQMGKTLTTAVYIAWRAIFFENQNIVVTGPKHVVSKDILAKVNFIIDKCPEWLRPAFVKDGSERIELSNGSKILARAFDSNMTRGMTVDFLYVDEVGLIPERKVNEFLQCVYPTVGVHGKIAFTSTPGADPETLKKLWEAVQDKDTVFSGHKVNWRAHPDRDDSWMRTIKGMIGDRAFDQEYECEL